MRLIDADKLEYMQIGTNAYVRAEDILSATPVDAVPVVHGRWKAVKDGEDDYRRICSCCGEDAPYDESDDCYLLYLHCPGCGAKMDGKGDGNETD